MLKLHRARRGSWVLVASLATLGGCLGGGGGGDAATNNPPPTTTPPTTLPPSGPVLTAGVPGLVGDWLMNGCLPIGAESHKNFIRATALSPTSIRHEQGVVSFANLTCSGAGTLIGPTLQGAVVFSVSESNASLAASGGEFTTVANTRHQVIWAKRSNTVLCLMGGTNPFVSPFLASAAVSLSTIPDSSCYTKQ